MNFLLAIYVLVSVSKDHYAPIKNAVISCDEITVWDEESNHEQGGQMSPTDSAGHMVFSGPLITYHCSIRATGYDYWRGELTFDERHRDRSAILTRTK